MKRSKPLFSVGTHTQDYTTRTPAVYWRTVLTQGLAWIESNLPKLEQLTKWRILSTSQVLVCTIDSVSRMLGDIEEAANESKTAGYKGWTIDAGNSSACLTVTTTIACTSYYLKKYTSTSEPLQNKITVAAASTSTCYSHTECMSHLLVACAFTEVLLSS
jgi:hypothetical protein